MPASTASKTSSSANAPSSLEPPHLPQETETLAQEVDRSLQLVEADRRRHEEDLVGAGVAQRREALAKRGRARGSAARRERARRALAEDREVAHRVGAQALL